MNYEEGETVSWEYGHAYLKVVKIIRIEASRVRLRGITSEYWMKRTTFDKNLGKPVPRASSMATANTL
ncbi:hypothetical protein [Marinobacter sp. ELB17]|uniref:hypothetical protein n=1 Tax=Marinobacter sp. ELB17 TaxID=270374 RepID=UPI0002EACC6E|nr:hypothetical protein [Marinobacter sp. ELB17]